ncbi:hypothetical protein Q7C_545 [Methylophaga frappieri]|uniref:Uncharacterized protein n=1 Tax=Methylophaga frappieri (strain ATCC BAA-2434 / DSM 25690 / JAM7) TaxID=754477 RepID=I1YFM5_METFJ|nr:hypothetical protein [Methylophaga frappieri]AFJ01718.1 hypothetical protein Q7C_545 [Methylophaga frappieri]
MKNHTLIPLMTIDIAVPVQAFRFEYTLVGRSDLPFIREFILRLLKVGNMSATQLAKFLGLSEKEISIAVSQLVSLNEISVDNEGNIQLTAEAHKYFDGLSDNRPKITKLFEGTSTFKFDLLSFGLIRSDDKISSPLNAIRLSPETEKLSNSINYAKSAFLRNYIDIFEEESISFDGVNDIRKVELYKLSDVRKNKDYTARFALTFSLDTERNSIERHSESRFFDVDEIQKNLNEVLLSSYNSSNIQDIVSALVTLNEPQLLDCFTSDGIDLTALAILAVKQSASSSCRSYFLGTPTNSANWNQLTTLIKKHLKDGKSSATCTWLAPSDRFWLMSNQSFSRTSELLNATKGLQTLLYLPVAGSRDKHQEQIWKKALGPMKDKAIKVAEGFLGGSVEVISIPGVFSLLCFYLQKPGESASIPFGFITTETSDIDRIQQEFESYLGNYDANMERREYGPLVLSGQKLV